MRSSTRILFLIAASSLALVWFARADGALNPNAIQPPALSREFRGAWLASVFNIDWPSRPGRSTAEQKQELINILDRLVELKFNAVFLQVRPSCDALYASKIEPWSEFLTGQMGQAPNPYYDPLEFAVTEAHKRGLELHAWLNPYRAYIFSGKATSAIATNHISKTHPELVRRYGKHLWLDPGEKAVQDHVCAVIHDIVSRYDVDGIHFDDYFYPYREVVDETTHSTEFPDDPSWQKYLATGGKLARDDWRRENVNTLVRRLFDEIKAEKSWVRFGISPFGIWQSGVPAQIKGLNSYAVLYADSRKWLAEGWVDYLAPQLYWAIGAPNQSFPVLLQWWTEQNVKNRQIWPGNSTSNVGGKWTAAEIINQIMATRKQAGAGGNILWNMKRVFNDDAGLGEALASQVYIQPSLGPVYPWLCDIAPPKPTALRVTPTPAGMAIHWKPGHEKVPGPDAPVPATTAPSKTEAMAAEPWLWVLQMRCNGVWSTEILPMDKHYFSTTLKPDAVSIAAVNRYGKLSVPVRREIKK